MRSNTATMALSAFAFMLMLTLSLAAMLNESGEEAQVSGQAVERTEDDGFPVIDWAYWQQVNEDVIAWVTVPGTEIDLPIVQAPADDPEYYLYHNVEGDWDLMGCAYLDAGCAEGGIGSCMNCVFSAHHIAGDDSSMFAPFARFGDGDYAREHKEILLQTPDAKYRLSVAGVAIIDGADTTKRTWFSGKEDFSRWWIARLQECSVTLRPATPARSFTFVTCSYTAGLYANERTLVYAVEEGA